MEWVTAGSLWEAAEYAVQRVSRNHGHTPNLIPNIWSERVVKVLKSKTVP